MTPLIDQENIGSATKEQAKIPVDGAKELSLCLTSETPVPSRTELERYQGRNRKSNMSVAKGFYLQIYHHHPTDL